MAEPLFCIGDKAIYEGKINLNELWEWQNA
mgnify:CR=1 FL=1